jgi:hypothetical protein
MSSGEVTRASAPCSNGVGAGRWDRISIWFFNLFVEKMAGLGVAELALQPLLLLLPGAFLARHPNAGCGWQENLFAGRVRGFRALLVL